jgi:hypothetical protein
MLRLTCSVATCGWFRCFLAALVALALAGRRAEAYPASQSEGRRV